MNVSFTFPVMDRHLSIDKMEVDGYTGGQGGWPLMDAGAATLADPAQPGGLSAVLFNEGE